MSASEERLCSDSQHNKETMASQKDPALPQLEVSMRYCMVWCIEKVTLPKTWQ